MASEWYVQVYGVEHGPLPAETLKALARNGRISPDTPVKLGVSGQWVAADHVKGLFTADHGQPPAARVPSPSPVAANHGLASDSQSDGSPKWIWGLVGAAVLFMCGLGIYAASWSKQRAEQIPIETANREVREAVEKAEKWIQDGRLSDADQIEKALNEAGANSVATEKGSVAPTLAAFRKAKGDRQAADILESAITAIAQTDFHKAQTLLREYLDHESATERQRAKTLLAEITVATSDDDALRTLLAMDDATFASFSKGNGPASLSHTLPWSKPE